MKKLSTHYKRGLWHSQKIPIDEKHVLNAQSPAILKFQ